MPTIRDAISEDATLIRALIQELAEYEGKAGHVQTTEADIARDGFGTNARFRTFIADWKMVCPTHWADPGVTSTVRLARQLRYCCPMEARLSKSLYSRSD